MERDYRKDFPLLMQDRTVYLDNAATAQRPQCVIDAEMDFYKNHNANPLRGTYPLSVEATDIYEQARARVAQFIHAASTEEVIFTRNTTEGINLVAYSYGLTNLKAGDEILVSIMEHHSNLLPWQMAARMTGASLKFLECGKDGSVDLDLVEKLITDRTKLVAVTQISNVLGRENPVREIAAIDYIEGIGFDEMERRELAVTERALSGLKEIPHVHVLGSERAEEHTGILTFVVDQVHPHDVSEVLIADGISVRAGHHCAQPLLQYLGVNSATRASFMFYNTKEEADRLVKSIASIRERMGYGR